MKYVVLLPLITSCALASCAIHPLPEDYTAVSTDVIVKQIRCETREAARQQILDLFRGKLESKDSILVSIMERLLKRFDGDDNLEEFSKFKPEIEFKDYPVTLAYIDLIYQTGIA